MAVAMRIRRPGRQELMSDICRFVLLMAIGCAVGRIIDHLCR